MRYRSAAISTLLAAPSKGAEPCGDDVLHVELATRSFHGRCGLIVFIIVV